MIIWLRCGRETDNTPNFPWLGEKESSRSKSGQGVLYDPDIHKRSKGC